MVSSSKRRSGGQEQTLNHSFGVDLAHDFGGAILARRLLEVEETRKDRRRREGYGAQIFLMAVGAVFLAFQLAPTEEMVLIGHRMTE
jgi:uncharacterized membrane protein